MIGRVCLADPKIGVIFDEGVAAVQELQHAE